MRLNINQFQTRGAKIYVQVNSKQNHNLQNIGDCQLYICHKNCYMYHSQNAHNMIVTIVNTQHDCRLMEVTPAKKNSTENYL